MIIGCLTEGHWGCGRDPGIHFDARKTPRGQPPDSPGEDREIRRPDPSRSSSSRFQFALGQREVPLKFSTLDS